jgi:hypothetical protein
MSNPKNNLRVWYAIAYSTILLTACGQGTNTQSTMSPDQIPAGMHLVTPQQKENVADQPKEVPAKTLQIVRGQYFTCVLPEGWKIGEDGQFALSMIAPDQKAFTLMVGNSGLFPDYTPYQFVYDKLMAIRPENLQIGNGQAVQPIVGFQQAYAFAVTYAIGGVPCQGEVKCHVAPYYGGQTMAMTAALSEARQWSGYSQWLPLVADQIAAHDGAAFGMRGVMQQNIDNSRAYAEAAKHYREWSQQNWQAVTDDRNSRQDRQQKEFRENIGAVQTYSNPYANGQSLELTTQYQYFWIDQKGTILGSNDPGINPNQGSTSAWKLLEKQ